MGIPGYTIEPSLVSTNDADEGIPESSHWWFIDNSQLWAWLEGEFNAFLVDNMAHMINLVARHPLVDHWRIFLCGLKAVAYAVPELLSTRHSLLVCSIVLGGPYGHGDSVFTCKQTQQRGFSQNMQERIPEFVQKWNASLARLRAGPPNHVGTIVAVDNAMDIPTWSTSKWC
eukprot:39346-Amphidinium_carterae.1